MTSGRNPVAFSGFRQQVSADPAAIAAGMAGGLPDQVIPFAACALGALALVEWASPLARSTLLALPIP